LPPCACGESARYGAHVDADKLLLTWEIYEQRALWQRELTRARADGNSQHAEVARLAVEELREIDPVDALAAGTDLVQLITGRRWSVILDARERGRSWADIGEAMSMTAAAARDFFQHALEDHEGYTSAEDASRARAVLDDRYILRRTPDGWRVTVIGRHGVDDSLQWKVAPADVSAATAQERTAQLVLDLGRGRLRDWVEAVEPGEKDTETLVAIVAPR
jgi:hypothetical protein